MSANDVAEAIMRLENAEDRERVADGDLSALDGLELSSEELALIIDDAEPETTGFGKESVMQLCQDPTTGKRGRFFAAAQYARPGISDPAVGTKFNAFLSRNSSSNF